jgi:DNA-binding beta-propeller fold protein YncE
MPENKTHCESIFGAVKITVLLRAPIKMTLHSNGLFRVWTASGSIDNAVHCLLRLPCQTRKRSFSVRRFILIGTLLLAALFICKAEAESPVATTESPHILVLDNCDSDYKTPPFNDMVLSLDSKGKVINQIIGFNICQNVGANRAISVSRDGRFFVVCENVADKISAFDISTGSQLWSVQGKYTSAVVAKDIVYALTSDGTIYGNGIQAFDRRGGIIKQSTEINGYDIVVDPNGSFLWVVGDDIKKCDMNLKVVKTLKPIKWCAVSVDISANGSIWVAEREHPDVAGSPNRLINISPKCTIIQTIPLKDMSPLCVRVDRSDGNVWVTGVRFREYRKLSFRRWPPGWERDWKYLGSRTCKYSSEGKLLLELKPGGKSIDIDASDGSVWITDTDTPRLYHYSNEGKKLDISEELSNDHKWITILPKQNEGD